MKTTSIIALLLIAWQVSSAQIQCCKDHLTHVPHHPHASKSNTEANDNFSYLKSLPKEALSEEEKQSLVQMREEEVLTHDLYHALYDSWKIRVFSNIADNESRQNSAIKTLLDKYNIPDPAAKNPAGQYTNKSLQARYDKLKKEGSRSYEDALSMGAQREEADIKEIKTYLEGVVNNQDIYVAFSNLRRASENHLRVFTNQLSNRGRAYTPTHLEKEYFYNIINRMHP